MFGDCSIENPAQISPRVLAHLGDAVFALFVRETMMQAVKQGSISKVEKAHLWSSKRESAAFQVEMLKLWQPLLTEEEIQLMKRARNMPVSAARRSQHTLHRQATAFEALLGFWYIASRERLMAMLEILRPLLLSEESKEA